MWERDPMAEGPNGSRWSLLHGPGNQLSRKLCGISDGTCGEEQWNGLLQELQFS